MKNSKIGLVLATILGGIILFSSLNFAQANTTNCPANTTFQETTATLVGNVTNDGGDPNSEVWLEYGQTTSYGSQTAHDHRYGVGPFCEPVYNLTPCTTYHYRAAAKNSAGTSYGGDQTFTTTCLTPTVDLKANGSDAPSNNPLKLYYSDSVNLSWTSSNANSCQASGDWSGAKNTAGQESMQLNSIKTYTFTITCQGSNNQEATDTVYVQVSPRLPTVVTVPPNVDTL